MILPEDEARRHDARHHIPAELTSLPRWACWRAWNKAGRVTREPVHPATGKNLRVSRPETWATFNEVNSRPAGRKPADGIGLLVRADDGLAVVMNAPAGLPARLGPNLVYAERALVGDGLTVVVRLGVHGAKTNRFVPLSGQTPYQDRPADVGSPNPDAIRTQSGRPPYQEEGQSGQGPYQGGGTNPDELRTVFSSSPQNNYRGVAEDLRREVDEFARAVCEQGTAGGRARWVYGLIGMLRRHGLTPQTIPVNLLLTFAERVGEDVGAVHRLVLARWENWRPHKVPLSDALKAVRADPSLLADFSPVLADEVTLTAAGMCKFMGSGGRPFPLPGRALAEVLGLRDQQEGSDVVRALVGLGLIRKVEEASYAAKRAAEYVWVEAVVESVRTQTDSPLLTARRPVSRRPGHSPEQTAEFGFRSRLGGYLTAEHYLAEMMLARRLTRDGQDLFDEFWAHPVVGPEYGRQVAAARSLLKDYSVQAVCRALRSKEGQSVYSLAAPYVVHLVEVEQARVDRQAALRLAAVAPSTEAMTLASGPRPPFNTGHTLFATLKGL